MTAWLCRWDDTQLLVHADTIENARLAARHYAGPTTAVGARLATTAEQSDPELNRPAEAP